jgi:hypothetical protein
VLIQKPEAFEPYLRRADANPLTSAITKPPAKLPDRFKTWTEFFVFCGLPLEVSINLEASFLQNKMGLDQIPDLNIEILKELGVKVGHLMKILKVVNMMHDRDSRKRSA